MTKLTRQLKSALRNRIKTENLIKITPDLRRQQSDVNTTKVIATEAFQNANKISIFLSTPTEVDTIPLLEEIFKHNKHAFVPTYTKDRKEMLRLRDMADYESLPVTKHNIKQPRIDDDRESALETGGIDLFLVPGLSFTPSGGRLGYGMGFYDTFLHRYFDKFGNKPILMALAFNEQIIREEELPIEEHDIKLDYIVTEGNVYKSK